MCWGPVPAERERATDVIGVGEVSLDLVLELESLLASGGKQRVRNERVSPGGQVATCLLGCARLGLRTAFFAAVGDDGAGDKALEPLRAAGVDVASVQVVEDGTTRQAVVLVEAASGERSVLERRDPRVRIARAALDPSRIGATRAVVIDATDPDASHWAARVAREAGAIVFLDVDEVADPLEKILPLIDFPVVSQRFAEEIGSRASVLSGLEALCRAGARVAVATLGERGALALSDGRVVGSGAFEVAPVDTTGAGDAFRAGFVAAVLAGEELETSLRAANAVAALNCVARGAQGGLPTRAELVDFLASGRQRTWREPE